MEPFVSGRFGVFHVGIYTHSFLSQGGRNMTEHAERNGHDPLVAGEPPRKILEPKNGMATIPQYSLSKILLVWAAAAIPMGILGWFVAPALAHATQTPAIVRLAVLTVGLVW